jgi:hypothetical protein
MMSRITLNLRKNMQRPDPEQVSMAGTPWVMNIGRMGHSNHPGSRAGSRAGLLRHTATSMELLRNGGSSIASKDLEAYVLDISSMPEDTRQP